MSTVAFQKETPEATQLYGIDAQLRELAFALRREEEMTQFEKGMANATQRSLVRRRFIILTPLLNA